MKSAIILYPHNSLTKVAKPLTLEDIRSDTFRCHISSMFMAMYKKNGVGLAGPQIGWNARVFIGNPANKTAHASQSFVYINPEILSIDKELETDLEGCLSLPDCYVGVPRYKKVGIRALNIDGKEIEVEVSDFIARIVQHEYDHLDGLMMIDRLNKEELKPIEQQLLSQIKRVKAMRRRRELAMRKELAKRLKIQKSRAKNKERRKRKRKK